jgi:hypothetical protein
MTNHRPWMYRKQYSQFITVNGVEMVKQLDGSLIERWRLELDGLLPCAPDLERERFFVN